jgi:hypothetical protein
VARGPSRAGNQTFTVLRYDAPMSQSRAIADLEADIVALRAAAERAGTALACLFSSSDEFEAAVVRLRREQGAYGTPARSRRPLKTGVLIVLMAIVFVLI